MTEDIDDEIIEPVAALKIEEGRAFISAIKLFLEEQELALSNRVPDPPSL